VSAAAAHRHRFRICAWSGTVVESWCRCGERESRPTTKQEAKEIRDSFMKSLCLSDRHPDNIHRVWFDFERRFFKFKEVSFKAADPNKPGRKKTYKSRVQDGWKLDGWKLIQAIERWAKKRPDDVCSAVVDDSSYSGSRLFFVAHRNGRDYHGTTVVYVPQDGYGAGHFFMYPSHRQGVADALREVLSWERRGARDARAWRKANPRDLRAPWRTES